MCFKNNFRKSDGGEEGAEEMSYIFAVAAGVAPGALNTGNSRVSNLTGHSRNAGWTLQEATESASAANTEEPCV